MKSLLVRRRHINLNFIQEHHRPNSDEGDVVNGSRRRPPLAVSCVCCHLRDEKLVEQESSGPPG